MTISGDGRGAALHYWSSRWHKAPKATGLHMPPTGAVALAALTGHSQRALVTLEGSSANACVQKGNRNGVWVGCEQAELWHWR